MASEGLFSESLVVSEWFDDSIKSWFDESLVSKPASGGTSQTLAITLDGVTASVTQVKQSSQSLAITLDGITAAVSQKLQHSQALAITLDSVTAASSQTLRHSQSASATLGDVVVAVSQSKTAGGATYNQSLAITLDSITSSITQTATHNESLAITLDSVTASATQVKTSNQSAAVTLDDITALFNQSIASTSKEQSIGFTLDDIDSNVIQINSNTTSTGAADYSIKKKYFVRKDNQLLVFNDKQSALDHLNEELDAVSEINALIDIDVQDKTEVQPQEAKQALQPTYNIELMLQTLRDNAQAEYLLNARNYQALLAMYERHIDEEEIELILLMAA